MRNLPSAWVSIAERLLQEAVNSLSALSLHAMGLVAR